MIRAVSENPEAQPPASSGFRTALEHARSAARAEETPAAGSAVGALTSTNEVAADAGAARNTLLQFASQLATMLFTAGLTLYLVRALGAGTYGVYALAVSVGGLMLFPAGMGLPMGVGRFLADHRSSPHQLREIFRVGTRLQVPAAMSAAVGLFAVSGAIADAYQEPRLGWPLRWVALSVFGQAMFSYLASVGQSVRRASVGLCMTVVESAVETASGIALVVVGAGAAGAALGKFVGYSVATCAGIYLTVRLLGRRGPNAAEPRQVSLRMLTGYAGAMFIVDVTWTAIAQLDVVLIGAVLNSMAVGSFGAVLRISAVLGYLGVAVASGVAPRLSLAGGDPDVRSFVNGVRYLTIVQGLVIAPMVVWAGPIVHLLLGSGYRDAPGIMRALTPFVFLGGPAALITVAVSYLGEARRRVPINIGTLALGLLATFLLIHAVGVVGAAAGDDVIRVVYVSAHLWLCGKLISLDFRSLAWSAARTVMAASAMALVLLAVGTGHLTPAQWILGGSAGVAAFLTVLVLTRELSLGEIRGLGTSLRAGALGR